MMVRLAKVEGKATLYVFGASSDIAGEIQANIVWYPGKEPWSDMITRMLAEAERRAANGADAPAGEARP